MWVHGEGGTAVLRLWTVCASGVLHCRVQQLKLVLGLHHLHDLQDPGLAFHIKAAIKHPGYNRNYENDLALLKVQDGGPEGLPRPNFPQPLTGPLVPTAGWTIAAQQECPTAGFAKKEPSQAGRRCSVQHGWLGKDPPRWAPSPRPAGVGSARPGHPHV